MSDSRLFLGYVALGVVLLAGTSTAAGQSFGVVGGANFTSIDAVNYGNAQATFDNAAGYHVGAYLSLGIGPLGVRPGVRYLHAGAIYQGLDDVVGPGSGLDDSFDVSFVSAPVDVLVRVPAPVISPYAFAGPEFRLQRTPDAPAALEDEFNDWSFLGNIGIGAEIDLPGAGLTLTPEVRYSFGLSDLIEDEFTYGNQTFTATDQRRPESFFISLGIEP